MSFVSICIATFKRPEKLGNLLRSIDSTCQDAGVQIELIVVDNDQALSATPTLQAYAENGKFELISAMQSQQNIALTRNKAVDLARGDYLIFVDDDEEVCEGWLQALLATREQYQADAVFGPVETRYEDSTPEWVVQGGFFQKGRHATGTRLPHGATCNTLVKASLFKQDGYRFDAAFGLTGGSDTEVFYRMNQAGKVLVWCDQALVVEDVDSNRINPEWLVKRSFRSGQCFSRVILRERSSFARALEQLKQTALLVMALALLPLAALRGQAAHIKGRQAVALRKGRLLFSEKHLYREYKQS